MKESFFESDTKIIAVHQNHPVPSVKYFDPGELTQRRLVIKNGLIVYPDGKPYSSSAHAITPRHQLVSFVLDQHHALYFIETRDGPYNQHRHSSATQGAPVIFAGEWTVENGRLTALTNKSGHYLSTEITLKQFLGILLKKNSDITDVDISTAVEKRFGLDRKPRGKALSYLFNDEKSLKCLKDLLAKGDLSPYFHSQIQTILRDNSYPISADNPSHQRNCPDDILKNVINKLL